MGNKSWEALLFFRPVLVGVERTLVSVPSEDEHASLHAERDVYVYYYDCIRENAEI
jgi:hypothetical protein